MNASERYTWYCQKVLPLVFDNSLSYYEVLCKLGEAIKGLAEDQKALEETVSNITDISADWDDFQKQIEEELQKFQDDLASFETVVNTSLSQYETQYKQDYQSFTTTVNQDIYAMNETLKAIQNGAYVYLYLDSIQKYINNNVQKLVKDIVSYVTFGLTADGHFCAYIPPTWDFITFSTITDPDSPLYNHLVLSW